MARAICGVLLKDRKTTKDLMLMMGLKETMHQLAMQCLLIWSCFEERRWSCVENGIGF